MDSYSNTVSGTTGSLDVASFLLVARRQRAGRNRNIKIKNKSINTQRAHCTDLDTPEGTDKTISECANSVKRKAIRRELLTKSQNLLQEPLFPFIPSPLQHVGTK